MASLQHSQVVYKELVATNEQHVLTQAYLDFHLAVHCWPSNVHLFFTVYMGGVAGEGAQRGPAHMAYSGCTCCLHCRGGLGDVLFQLCFTQLQKANIKLLHCQWSYCQCLLVRSPRLQTDAMLVADQVSHVVHAVKYMTACSACS